MSLLFFDSFKNYTFLPLKWDERTANSSFYVKEGVYGRNGGSVLCCKCTYIDYPSDYVKKSFVDTQNDLFVGFAYKRVFGSADHVGVLFCNDSEIKTRLVITPTGLYWDNGSFVNSYGKNFYFDVNRWYYLETYFKFSTTSGTVTLRVDENVVLHTYNFPTISGAPEYINNIKLCKVSSSLTSNDFAYIEDLYISNTSGTSNNTFIGNCRVTTLPILSAGTYQQFLPSNTYSGTDNKDIITNTVYPSNTTTYSGTFYEYASADDGGYTRQPTWAFNNTGVTVPSPSVIYMDQNTTYSYYWFRFSNINIPKNSKITNAYLVVNATVTQTTNIESNIQQIFMQKSGTPPAQVTSYSDFIARKFTYNKTSIKQGHNVSNKDIKASFQELVDLSTWQESNNSVLVAINIYYVDTISNYVNCGYTSYDANNDPYHVNSPKLVVEWQLPAETTKYVYTVDLGARDTYYLNTSSGVENPLAVSVNITAKKSSDSTLYLASTVTSGINYTVSQQTIPKTRFKTISFIYDTTPDTSESWSEEFLTNDEFGFVTTVSG